MTPLVTVCLITYNHAPYISRAIESVLMQETDFAFELLIADDCSKDGTRDILKEYQQKFPGMIKLILQKKNVGAYQNWHDLVTAPTTPYIAYFEGDDYWIDPLKLQKQFDFLEANKDFSICCTNGYLAREENGFTYTKNDLYKKESLPSREIPREELLYENCIFTLTIMYRNLIPSYPEWMRKAYLGDWSFLILLSSFGRIMYLSDVTVVYCLHQQGLFSGIGEKKQLPIYIETGEILRNNIEKPAAQKMMTGQRDRVNRLLDIYRKEGSARVYAGLIKKYRHLLNAKDTLKHFAWLIKNALKRSKHVLSKQA